MEAEEMFVPRAGPASVLQRRTRQIDPPGPGEVQVRIEAAGVAFADIVLRRGVYPLARPPVVPGYDFVGRVETVGPGVTRFAPGARVAGVTITGSYASRRNVEARWLAPAPEGASAAPLAAAVLNGVTALQMLRHCAPVGPDEWALVHGAAGGVGGLLVAMARRAGAKVIGTASAGKLRAVETAGAIPIDHGAPDLPARIRKLSGGGVAAAFDHVGPGHFAKVTMPALGPAGAGALYGAYEATRDGKINPLAAAGLFLAPQVSPWRLFGESRSVTTYAIDRWRAHRTALYLRDLTDVLAMAAAGDIAPDIGATFPLAQAADAQRALEQRQVTGKIVLVMAED